MEKKIFGGALAVLMLTACSNDELVNVNRDGDEITFSVVTNAGSRASDVYCNNNKPADFEVYASYGGKTYIDGDLIKYQETEWVNTDGTRYWPESGEVSFYAHKNAGEAFKWDAASAPKIENFTVAKDVANQVDLIYSVQKASKPASAESNSPVMLNFRHALSQIVFQAKNINPNLYVEISGVSVCKLGGANTFTYPSGKTDSNIEDHEGTAGTSINYVDGSWGTWGALTGGTEQYNVTFTPVKLKGDKNATASSLTNTNETGKEFSKKALLLLPQTTTAWDVTSAEAEGTAANQGGSYFLVKCKIYNVANSTTGFDPSTDVCLWPGENSENPDNIAIPVAVNWEQGKKYIYTFVFGEGNGGYDPEPGPDDPDPEPVLIPIKFDVTVDDFVPVANEDIEMDEPDNN